MKNLRKLRLMATLATGILSSALVIGSTNAQEADSVDDAKMTLDVRVGASHLELPKTFFSLLSDGSGNTISKFENHDGNFTAPRIDISLQSGSVQFAGMPVVTSVSGFYAHFEADNTVVCTAGFNPPDCSYSNIIQDATLNKTRFGSITWPARTNREVEHWGLSLQATAQSFSGSIFKPKAGLAIRAIDQNMDILAEVPGIIRTTYNETLDTRYYGGFVGMIGTREMGGGFSLSIDAEVGLYHAATDYRGHYTNDENNNPFDQDSRLSLDSNELAVIAILRLSAIQKFDGFSLSVFGEGEFYSYAPKMEYNDTSASQNRSGIHSVTSIVDGEAYSITAGAKITVPLN